MAGKEKIPTAVEFAQENKFKADLDDDFFYIAMVEFAKMHVKKAKENPDYSLDNIK